MNETKGIAVVTGAGRGIGRSISVHLAAAGFRVILTSRSLRELESTAEVIADAGGEALVVVADVTSEADVARLTATANEVTGNIDLLVNNAGGAAAVGPVWEASIQEWWGDIELNLRGPFLTTRMALPGMIANGSGRIINLASIIGTRASPYTSAYATAKAGLLLFTESTELALADTGVHVFAISPGMVRTPGFEKTNFSDRGRQWFPQFSAIDDESMLAPDHAATLVVKIASGSYDALAGRFIHVSQDIDLLNASADAVNKEDQLVMRLRQWPASPSERGR